MSDMEKQIHILHLEDDAVDAELVQAALDSADIPCQIKWVEIERDFIGALRQDSYDLILADYKLPSYDGLSALNFVREQYPSIPFIFVSGTLGEDAAISALTKGAIDYVTKQKLSRLAPAVQRALREAENQAERQRAEEELRKSNALLERIFSSTEFLIAYLDADFNFIRVNRAYAEADQQTPEFFVGKNHFDLYPNEENEAIFRRVVETGEPYIAYAKPFEYAEHPERGITYWNWTLQPVKETGERVTGLVYSLIDVTERERAIIAQRESDALYRTLVEQADIGIFVADPQGNYIDANPSGCIMLGYTREEILKLNMRNLVSAENQKATPIRFKELKEGKSVISERMMVKKDGSLISVEISGKALSNGNLLGIVRDITERKQMEEALAAREREFRTLAENSPDNIARYDLNCRTLYVNPVLERTLGAPLSEILGTTPIEAALISDAEIYQQKIDEVIKDGRDYEMDIVLPDTGEGIRYHNIRFVAERGENGAITGVQTIGRDITERKLAEQEHLAHLHLLETLDQINRAMQGATDLEQMMSDVLDIMLSVLDCDRAFLMYPCDPNAPFWTAPMERCRPEYPGVHQLGLQMSMDADVARTLRELLASDHPLKFGPGTEHPLPEDVAQRFGFRSFMSIAIYPKVGSPWQFGVHQCSYARTWTNEEERLLQEVGRRLADAITVLLTFRNLQESEQRYRMVFENSPVSIWEEDFSGVKEIFGSLKDEGVADLETYLTNHPEIIRQCAEAVKVVDVNRAAITLHEAPNKEELLTGLVNTFTEESFENFHRELICLWNGETGVNADAVVKTLTGEKRAVTIYFSICPGYEETLSKIIVSLVDITERKRHEIEREAITTVSAALRKAITRNEILNIVLEQFINLFEADGAVLAVPDTEDGEDIIPETGRGIGEKFIGLHIPPGKGVSRWVIENRKSYLNNQMHIDPLFYAPELLGDSHCVAVAPLIAREKSIGAVWIARKKELTQDDARLINAIADIAANAIYRVMLYEQTERNLRHLTALHQIDLAITTTFDLNVTLNVILHNVKDELNADSAAILLLDSVSHLLIYADGIGFKKGIIKETRLSLEDRYAGRAALDQQIVSCLDLQHEIFGRSTLVEDEGFTTYHAAPLTVKGQVKGVLEVFHRVPFIPDAEWLGYFDTLSTQTAIAVENDNLFNTLQRSNMELTLAYDATIEGWSRALDLRDKETEGHTQRVTEMALQLAEKMGISHAEKIHIHRGALLHDIGKMGVPDSILNKPGKLTEEEWIIMRRHPAYAYEMLSNITYLKPALDIPYCHHEKWDGSGYPRGLKGNAIPLAARLFAVVDVFDALTSNRPYRKAISREEAYRYIQEQAGSHFDPQIVKTFLDAR